MYKKRLTSWNKGIPNTWYSPIGLRAGWEAKKKLMENRINKICKCGKSFAVPPCLNRIKSCSQSCSMKGTTRHKGYKHSEAMKQRMSLLRKGKDLVRLKKIGLKGLLVQQTSSTPTSIERKVYEELQKRGLLFEKQKLINGKFLVDAYIPSLNLVIEVDGNYWHSLERVVKKDRAENAYLTKCGFNLLRLSETEVNSGKFIERLVN